MNNLEVNSSKVNQACDVQRTNDRASANLVTINERVNLTKNQYEVLKTICHTYDESISDYMQEALIEAMRFDIEEGNFCDTLLEKINNDDKSKNNSPPPSPPAPVAPDLMKSDLDLLKKLRTEAL